MEPPRASLIAIAGEFCGPGIWMGGAHTPRGNEIRIEAIARSWFIDCAGDMPAVYRDSAERWLARVFPDIDGIPVGLEGIRAMVSEVTSTLRRGLETSPEHLYVVCQHGMNRSGLVAGLILRELGVGGEDAVERICRARPGALSNQAFRRIVLEG
jgi:hypothetical protein